MYNHSKHFISLLQMIFSMLLVLTISGCGNDDEILEIPDIAQIAEVAPADPELEQIRIERLKKIQQEPYPVYTITSGDSFSVELFGQDNVGIKQTVITPDGLISLKIAGPLKIGGLSLIDARNKITEEYKKYFRDPEVTLLPLQISSQTATISGSVANPGCYNVNADTRLSDMLAMAQGVRMGTYDGDSTEMVDWNYSFFIRDGEILPVDFNQAIKYGDPLNNLVMRKGDYIYIASSSDRRVSVIGEVNLPGNITWRENMGIIDVITACRGLKDEHWRNLLVLRYGVANPVVYRADIDSVLVGKKTNFTVLPGDIVYVPKDGISEYNVFIQKLMPTAQLINMLLTPVAWAIGR